MATNKGFANKAKSGAKALPARWRQAAQKGRLERASRAKVHGRARKRR